MTRFRRIGEQLLKRRRLGWAVAAACVVSASAAAQTVVDGDSLELDGKAYRLYGIDAPELPQACADGWHAGVAARDYLRELIGQGTVECTQEMGRRRREIEAVCRADGVDLGAAMVTGGLALAFVPFSARYISQEDAASSAQRGAHAHPCLSPAQWRADHGDDG